MKKKKLISLLLAASLIGSMALTGCGGGGEDDGGDAADNGLPTVTFTHGYYQDGSKPHRAGDYTEDQQRLNRLNLAPFAS